MFGVVQGGVGVTGPFANPPASPQFSQSATPNLKKDHSSSVRHPKNTTTLAPLFRDDTRLVAFRYDETVALEPPIPLPPPRSPLRPPPRFTLGVPTKTPSPIVVPPPRPPPPTQQHPALRTISTPRNVEGDTKRDSIHAPTISSSSHSYTCYGGDSSDEDEDPFAYENIDTVPGVRPLRLRTNSLGSSIYSLHERERNLASQHIPFPFRDRDREGEGEGEGEGAREAQARVSEADSSSGRPSEVSLSLASISPALSLSEGSTASPASTTPASPATPPPQFSKRFARSFSLRSGSSASTSRSSPSTSSTKRLRKKSLAATESGMRSERERERDRDKERIRGSGRGFLSGVDPRPSPTASGPSSSPPLPLPRSSGSATNPIHATNHTNYINPHPDTTNKTVIHGAPSSPIISTNIPCESFFEEDDLSKLSFSIRGSLIFGGKRPWRKSGSTSSGSHKMADEDVIREHPPHIPNSNTNKVRFFPLVPAAAKKDHAPAPAPTPAPPARPPRQDDMGVSAMIQKPFHPPESPHHHQPPHFQAEVVNDDNNPSTPRKLPPSIRVISAEAEKESQKVRSLYEPGEGLQLGDRDLPWGTLEPPLEVPSDVDGNDAPPNDQLHGPHTPTSASTSSPAQQDRSMNLFHELAGGIEDWEGLEGQDVDRYGFIVPHRPNSDSQPNTPNASPVRFSSRKHRNVLVRKDASSQSLGVKRGPTKKMSARSLNTYTSELSTFSRRSVRSTIRQATNKLPHNRDRRLVDEAGDLLALQPGLAHVTEAEGAEKMAAELKRKEAKRSEKWRKMARVVKPGSEGQGTVFDFDVKNPKLIERTWKGIPDCWRSAAWYSFLASSAKADPINYVADEELKAAFHRLVEEPSPDDMQIDLDVPRTINQHIMFRRRYRGGQRLLFRVLHALSLHFPETGYVQGMAPLAATLLSYYDEEQCFVMLVRLWQFRGLNRIYQSGFVELIGALKDFETHWLNGKDVADKLKELCIDPTAYATRWYLTLFNLSIPFPVQLRIWDVFMLLGSSPPERPESSSAAGKEVDGYPSSKGLEILHATSLAIIDTLQPTLIDADFENAMKSLTSWIPIKDEQKFLEIVQIEWKKQQSRQKKKV